MYNAATIYECVYYVNYAQNLIKRKLNSLKIICLCVFYKLKLPLYSCCSFKITTKKKVPEKTHNLR